MPEKPTDVPVNDETVTTDKKIKVSYASPAPSDNGSPLLSYDLQMDDGVTGEYVNLVGVSSNSMQSYFVVESVVKGRSHRLKYRAKNAIGWGPFSEPASILAATRPS